MWKVIWQSATQCAVQCHAWMRSTLTPDSQREVQHESGGHQPRGRTCTGDGLNWWCCQGLWISCWQDVSPLPPIILTYPLRRLYMSIISVIKYNCHMATVTIPVIVTVNMLCQHFHLLKGQKGHVELWEAFSRTPARAANYLQCQRSAPWLLHYPW